MPERYPPPYQTCDRRRFQQWVRSGIFEKILQALATDLRERGEINLSEYYIDVTFIVAKEREEQEIGYNGYNKKAKGSKVHTIVTHASLPVVVIDLGLGNEHESRRLPSLLGNIRIRGTIRSRNRPRYILC